MTKQPSDGVRRLLLIVSGISNHQHGEDSEGLDVAGRQQLPVMHCTRCGHLGYDITLANQRCGQRPDGKNRSKGLNTSAIGIGDFEECPVCVATGSVGDTRCERCSGHGWLYVRDVPKHMR
jgi:hypothetical protein